MIFKQYFSQLNGKEIYQELQIDQIKRKYDKLYLEVDLQKKWCVKRISIILSKMGSSNSSTQCSAAWKGGKQCSCCQSHYKVTKIRWISVPMPAEGFVKTGRLIVGIASLGITELAVYKGHNYSHDVIELWVTCRNCRKIMRFTMEFSKSGKQATFGYYKRYKPGEGWAEKDKDNLTFLAARKIYNSTRGGKYDIGNNNCKHFAKRLYNRF